MKQWRTLICIFLCLIFLPVAAMAEDCFLIDVDMLDMNSLSNSDYVAANLSAQTQGIRIRKYISDGQDQTAPIRLTVMQAETSTVVFDKNYGDVGGTFDSGDIYLPYIDNNAIPYLVTLSIADWTYAMPFMHMPPRLSYNSGCTFGVRLRDYNPSITNNWVMGTMLDLDLLRTQGSTTLPLSASNAYIIGEANVSLYDNQLTVYLSFYDAANVELHQSSVYVIGSVSMLTTDDPSHIGLPAYMEGEPIDVSGLSSALLFVPLLLSYDPSSLTEFYYDLSDYQLSEQFRLWSENQNAPAAQVDTPSWDDGTNYTETPWPSENDIPEDSGLQEGTAQEPEIIIID